jgi:hypothetical protein
MRSDSPSTVLGFIVAVHPQSVDLIHFNSSLGAFASLHLRICSSLPMEGKEKPSSKQELPLRMDIIDLNRKKWFKWQPRESLRISFFFSFLCHAREARGSRVGLIFVRLRNNDQNN